MNFSAADCNRAFAEKQFAVYYQPKYCLKTGGLVGAEALVRWDCPVRGFLPPGDFVPDFESSGLITRLDLYVLEEVCAFLRGCANEGLSPVPISVNVSRVDLLDLGLADKISAIVEHYGLEPTQLCLEITESAYADTPEKIVAAVARLNDAGFPIAMDDFGTGYSSLYMLGELPIDTLKLDRALVQKSAESGEAVAGLTIEFAKRMNLTVVAEGVETREQAERLCAMDCDEAQGHYFCEPKPERDFAALLVNGGAERHV